MAGTLTISTLSDGTNSTSSTNCIQGSAKAWISFNGTAATVRASYNVSSVTRVSAGAYYFTFTNAMSDANYSLIGSGISGGLSGVVFTGDELTSRTTARTGNFYTQSPINTSYDSNNVSVAIFR